MNVIIILKKIDRLREVASDFDLSAGRVLRLGGSAITDQPGERLVLVPSEAGLADVPAVEDMSAVFRGDDLAGGDVGDDAELA